MKKILLYFSLFFVAQTATAGFLENLEARWRARQARVRIRAAGKVIEKEAKRTVRIICKNPAETCCLGGCCCCLFSALPVCNTCVCASTGVVSIGIGAVIAYNENDDEPVTQQPRQQ